LVFVSEKKLPFLTFLFQSSPKWWWHLLQTSKGPFSFLLVFSLTFVSVITLVRDNQRMFEYVWYCGSCCDCDLKKIVL
jgi:hypothetical protein